MRNIKCRGFTLLEMMVIIIILGLLASLTIPSVMSNKNRADQLKALSDIAAIENALD
ncbi:TPA: prepilin-type N-terminal cleavage/methylation domain-containing protein, partial [Yersinia enterocolitica]